MIVEILARYQFMILLVLVGGLVYYIVQAAKKREESWSLDSFFYAGRNLGSGLTTNTTWATSFSFANGIYYFSFLGYMYGPAVIWFQIPWCLALGFLIWQAPRILKETEKNSLHGFLAKYLGPETRKLAAWMSILAFMGMVAYEINITSEILLTAFGQKGSLIFVSIIVAVFAAAYTDLGGFLGTSTTDKYQNRFGLIAVAIILLAMFLAPSINAATANSTLPVPNVSPWAFLAGMGDLSRMPWVVFFGILSFALFLNIVDMSNWQVFAANSDNKDRVTALRWSIARAAAYVFVLPGVVGTFIGWSWYGVTKAAPQETFTFALTYVAGLPSLLFGSGEISLALGGLLLAAVIFGLVSVALSTIDSYLIVSSQAITTDIRKQQTSMSSVEEKKLIGRARRDLYLLSITSVVVLMLVRHLIQDDYAFALQFIIASFAISLVPSTFQAFLLGRNGKVPKKRPPNYLAPLSIGLGSLAAFAIYLSYYFSGNEEWNPYSLGPIAALLVSAAVTLIGAIIHVCQQRKQ